MCCPRDPPSLHTVFSTKLKLAAGFEVLERNVLTSAELKRRGIAAIEQALQHGPVHLIKHNQGAGVVLSEQHYRQLQLQASRAATAEPTTLNWLLNLPPAPSPRSKTSIDADLATERDW